MKGYFVKNIGQNRGKPRIWLEKLEVSQSGMKPGDRYDIHIKGGTVVLRMNPDGTRVVSKKTDKSGKDNPIIDINSQELLALFDGMSSVRLVQREGEIYLLPLATEIRKKERLTRLRNKVLTGQPLDTGSLSHGAGFLTAALHDGLTATGLNIRHRLANEVRPELLSHAAGANSAWDAANTIPIGAPMQEFAFDESAMRHVPRLDIMEAGLPCSGASVAGRAARGLGHPEEHPLVGHLVVAALVILSKANPAVIVFENVIPYSNSASASILRNQLRDMGYVTHETTLKGEEFNSLEHRNRWCMVAVTEGMHFDWDMLVKPDKNEGMTLSDVLDDIDPNDPMWSEMTGLKAKQIRDLEAGKNFKMQIFSADSEKIATVTKGYAKNRSTDPKIAHPTDPNLLRLLTPSEHARVKQQPPELIEGLSATIAHEVLGQAIVRGPFEEAAKLLGRFIQDYAEGKQVPTLSQLTQDLTAELTDLAAHTCAEIRKPAANVIYEGPITATEAGIAIQDIGGGVGILHMGTSLQGNSDNAVRLGEVIRVQYPSQRSLPNVERLSEPAPAVTNELSQAQEQLSLIDSTPKQRPTGPRFG